MSWNTWLIYLLACVGLSLSPGPNGLLALTHGALYGPRRTLATIAGGVTGFVLLVGLSLLGIGALLQASGQALTLLKWVGGAYLVWLGIQLWRAPPVAAGDLVFGEAAHSPAWRLFRTGLLSAITNPKGLLFFAAFLSQFIDPDRSLWLQFVLLAGTFAATEFLTELALAGMAARIGFWLKRVGRGFNRACGGLFVLIGLALPLRG